MSTPTAPLGAPKSLTAQGTGGVGENPLRPDGILKVRGEFAYSSDLWMEGMIWGVTLRSPHPVARIRSIDISEALAVGGMHAVLTSDEVPGNNRYGLQLADQPVLTRTRALPGRAVALVATRGRPAGGEEDRVNDVGSRSPTRARSVTTWACCTTAPHP
jgi:CO/xanthine dehydrogenase Mo-binding subunit